MADEGVFEEQVFTVQEGLLYKILRGAAIGLNRMFFGAVLLLIVWLFYAGATGAVGCDTQVFEAAAGNNTTMDPVHAANEDGTCSVFLSTTSLYLGSMAVITFVGSILFGLLGLAVGKNVLPVATPVAEEVGARRQDEDEDDTEES